MPSIDLGGERATDDSRNPAKVRAYHRLKNNTTQTDATARLQQSSGEIWGAVPRNGGAFRCVQAYRNGLPAAASGIEFITDVPPTPGTGTPYEARWIYCDPGVPRCTQAVTLNAQGFAVLAVTVTKIVP